MKSYSRNLVPLLVLATLAILPLWKLMAGREMVFLGDALYQHYPWQAAVSRLLAEAPSLVPLWNPYGFCGSPLLADPQSQVLYPPALFYRFLPYAQANGWFIAFHAVLACAGMGAFLAAQGVALRHALFGSLGFALGAHSVMLGSTPPVLAGYSWLPLVALFARRLAGAPGPANAVALGLVLGWQVLAGYPQYLLYALVFATVIILASMAPVPGRWKFGAAAVLVCGAVAAGAFIPFLAYLPETTRAAAVSASEAAAGAMAPWKILGLLSPLAFTARSDFALLEFGTRWLDLHFIGVIALALAVYGAAVLRGRERFAALVLAAVGAILALGPWVPGLGAFLQRIPPFSHLRHAGLWMGLAGFGLAWLAALGAREAEARLSGPGGKRLLEGILVSTVFLAVLGGVARLMLGWYSRRWGAFAGNFAGQLGSLLHPAAVLALLALLLWLARRREIRPSTAFVAAGVVAFMELLMVRAAFQPAAKPAWLMEPGALESAMLEDRGFFRVFVAPRHQELTVDEGKGLEGVTRNIRAAFRSNLSMAAGLRDADGSNPLKPAGVDALLGAAKLAGAPWREPARSILSDLGVRYLVAKGRIPGDGWPAPVQAYAWLYRNPGARGPVWVEPASSGSVRAGSPRSGSWMVEARLDGPATVVLSETALNGWRVSGAPAGTRVDKWRGALCAVKLPAGRHSLVFDYDPIAPKLGLGLGMAGLVVILGWGLAWFFRRRNAGRNI